MWRYCITTLNLIKAMGFSFADMHSADHVQTLLGQRGELPWKGKLVTQSTRPPVVDAFLKPVHDAEG